MTVQEIRRRKKPVTGAGYEPRGQYLGGRPTSPPRHSALAECLKAGLLCNNAQLACKENRWHVEEIRLRPRCRRGAQGRATEAELSVAHPRLDAIPLSPNISSWRLHAGGAGRLIYKKGAAERIIERCTTSLDDHGQVVPFDQAHAREAVEHMATKGCECWLLPAVTWHPITRGSSTATSPAT